MSLKGFFICSIICVQALTVSGQFRNLNPGDRNGEAVCAPTVAINPRYPNNIVISAKPNHVWYSKDTGKTWAEATHAFAVNGYPTVIADDKGKFLHIHPANRAGGEEGSATGKSYRIVMGSSDDGGESWAPAEPLATGGTDRTRQWAGTDSRGNIFVTWTQVETPERSGAACQSNVLFSMSKNGKKWTEPVVISQQAGDCSGDDAAIEGAVAAATSDGKMFVAWANQEKIYIDRSFNGGEWWLSNDIVVADQRGGWNLTIPGHDHINGKPVLMTDNSKTSFRGSLYLVWADQRNGEDDTDIWFTRSHNFGDNWSFPMRINNDGKGKHQYMPWLTVDQTTGHIYVVYYDRRNYDDNRTDVYLAYSFDGGATFKNVQISEKSFVPQEGIVFGDHINITAHKGLIIPVWTRADDGRTSVWTVMIRQEDLPK